MENKIGERNKISEFDQEYKSIQSNECPKKDKDGNCLVPGVYSDSDEIGGG